MNLFIFPFEINDLQNLGKSWHGYRMYIGIPKEVEQDENKHDNGTNSQR